MRDFLVEVLSVVIPGALVAFIASAITVRLSIRQFHAEKWWEKKQEAYSRLLEVLHKVKEHEGRYYEREVYRREFTDDEQAALLASGKQNHADYAKCRDLASFHLSPGAVKILDAYEKKRVEARKNEDFFSVIDGELAAVTECLEALKHEALRDLRVN